MYASFATVTIIKKNQVKQNASNVQERKELLWKEPSIQHIVSFKQIILLTYESLHFTYKPYSRWPFRSCFLKGGGVAELWYLLFQGVIRAILRLFRLQRGLKWSQPQYFLFIFVFFLL